MEETRREYNRLKQRYDKATKYFEDESIPNEEKEEFLQNFIEILEKIRVVYLRLKHQEGQQSII
ncbi:hypothetical protein [Gudongella sp. DL1XJH-153]|uniref:hypothetical protein n=1 Tax=Gudongella sp. DL1XJH-153 TaxID=3409804 RepID=UPI003BB61D48